MIDKKVIPPNSSDWEKLAAFAQTTKDYIIIIGDPKNDFLWASYGKKRVFAKVQPGMLKAVISHSAFSSNVVSFCASIQDLLSLSFRFAKSAVVPKSVELLRNFISFIDGAYFNITRQRKTRSNIMATPKINPVDKKTEKGPMIA